MIPDLHLSLEIYLCEDYRPTDYRCLGFYNVPIIRWHFWIWDIKKRANSIWNGQNNNARNTFSLECCQEARGTTSKSADCAHVFSGGGGVDPNWRLIQPEGLDRPSEKHGLRIGRSPLPPPPTHRAGPVLSPRGFPVVAAMYTCARWPSSPMTWQEQNHRLTTYNTSLSTGPSSDPKEGVA